MIMEPELKEWEGNYGNYLAMTPEQAASASHPGICDSDVLELSNDPAIRAMLDEMDSETLRKELSEYGAWSDEELQDRHQNEQRILWIAAGDITDGNV